MSESGVRGPVGEAALINVDDYLGLNKYNVDESHAHIALREQPRAEEFHKLVKACPAALYRYDSAGAPTFDYAGCLECGTCRIVCGDTIIERWENPQPTMGVEYRYG
jgi:ferredoxin-like protein FixX